MIEPHRRGIARIRLHNIAAQHHIELRLHPIEAVRRGRQRRAAPVARHVKRAHLQGPPRKLTRKNIAQQQPVQTRRLKASGGLLKISLPHVSRRLIADQHVRKRRRVEEHRAGEQFRELCGQRGFRRHCVGRGIRRGERGEIGLQRGRELRPEDVLNSVRHCDYVTDAVRESSRVPKFTGFEIILGIEVVRLRNLVGFRAETPRDQPQTFHLRDRDVRRHRQQPRLDKHAVAERHCHRGFARDFQTLLRLQHRVVRVQLGPVIRALERVGLDQKIIHEQLPPRVNRHHARTIRQIRHHHRLAKNELVRRRKIRRQHDRVVERAPIRRRDIRQPDDRRNLRPLHRRQRGGGRRGGSRDGSERRGPGRRNGKGRARPRCLLPRRNRPAQQRKRTHDRIRLRPGNQRGREYAPANNHRPNQHGFHARHLWRNAPSRQATGARAHACLVGDEVTRL